MCQYNEHKSGLKIGVAEQDLGDWLTHKSSFWVGSRAIWLRHEQKCEFSYGNIFSPIMQRYNLHIPAYILIKCLHFVYKKTPNSWDQCYKGTRSKRPWRAIYTTMYEVRMCCKASREQDCLQIKVLFYLNLELSLVHCHQNCPHNLSC